MHWVYVLLSDDGDIYVGETTRLFRRWNEHQTGRGGANTSMGEYNTVIGLYSVANNKAFRGYLADSNIYRCEKYWKEEGDKYDALDLENHITERYLADRGITRFDIKGGKYTTESRCENFCFGVGVGTYVKDRPLCKCKYPCEVKLKNDGTKIYFVCPVPEWVEGFTTPEKCNFWEEYKPFRENKENQAAMILKQCEHWVARLPEYEGDPCIKCNAMAYKPIWSRDINYGICEKCFHSHYGELKEEYKLKPRNVQFAFEGCD